MKVCSVLLIIVFCFTTNVFSQVQFISHTITTQAVGANTVFALDLDGDGDIDVLSSAKDTLNDFVVAWYENDGNENFTIHTITTDARIISSVFAVDVDGDGDIDVLSAYQGNYSSDGKIAWYENDGNEDFTTHIITENVPGVQAVYTIDVDDDGDMDVLSASFVDDKIAWYENDGNENFIEDTITINADNAFSVFAVDMDRDGDIDVLSASDGDNKIAWYENDGNENFIDHTISTDASGAKSVYAVDVDGDGDMDVLSASFWDDKIAWYENDGNENFIDHTISTDARGAESVYAVDLDGDGDMDVLSASSAENKIVWYENLLITGIETISNEIPSEFSLSQNYPNPFNPSTKMEYSVPSESFVVLKVYDVLGNEVATLVNEQQQAGVYRIDFNASELSSGIYFYKLQVGSFIESKKMILLR